MTLLLALSTASFSVVVSDRRLTREGVLVDDESTKLCVVCCDDARLAVAFTGTAQLGSESTQDWVRDTLAAVGARNHNVSDILAAWADAATLKFQAYPRETLSLLFSGFAHWTSEAQPIAFVVSNCHSFPKREQVFTQRTIAPDEGVILEAAGSTGSFMKEHRAALKKMLMNHAIAGDAVSRAAILRIQRMVRDSGGGGTVGPQCNSAIIHREPDSVISCTYHSARKSFRAFTADIVFASSQHQGCYFGIKVQAESVLSGPAIRKRDPCWCGNGKEFRSCHMKTLGEVYARAGMFRCPLPFTIQSRSTLLTTNWWPAATGTVASPEDLLAR